MLLQRVPDAVRDDRAVRGGVPAAEGARPLHLRPRPHLRPRRRRMRPRIQHPQGNMLTNDERQSVELAGQEGDSIDNILGPSPNLSLIKFGVLRHV